MCSLHMSYGLECVISNCMNLLPHTAVSIQLSHPSTEDMHTHHSLKHSVFDHTLFIYIWIECCNCSAQRVYANIQHCYGFWILGLICKENMIQDWKDCLRFDFTETDVENTEFETFQSVINWIVWMVIQNKTGFSEYWHKNFLWTPNTRAMVQAFVVILLMSAMSIFPSYCKKTKKHKNKSMCGKMNSDFSIK